MTLNWPHKFHCILYVMFTLYFFCENNSEMSIGDVYTALTHHTETVDIVREGEFDTLEEAIHRMINIGSRWYFYPNACIKFDDVIVGIYFEDGLVLEFDAQKELSFV